MNVLSKTKKKKMIQSFMARVARQAPADQASILCDCHAAMALFERTRKEDFDPMRKVQGRGAILQLFLSTQVPLSPATTSSWAGCKGTPTN